MPVSSKTIRRKDLLPPTGRIQKRRSAIPRPIAKPLNKQLQLKKLTSDLNLKQKLYSRPSIAALADSENIMPFEVSQSKEDADILSSEVSFMAAPTTLVNQANQLKPAASTGLAFGDEPLGEQTENFFRNI